MVNVLIQILTLGSGLLVNFLIPILFGLEKYGLFIKANILVFLFHKFTDVISEPLISIQKQSLFATSLFVNAIILGVFLICNLILPIGNPWLLTSMLWSNTVLLTIYAHSLHRFLLIYLSCYIFLFIALFGLTYLHLLSLSITSCLIYTNVIPSTLCFSAFNLLKLVNIRYNLNLNQIISIILLIPRLISITLVSNLFANIIPFYISFVISPQALALFKVQVSIVQSVTAIFPLNNKIITTLLQNKRNYHEDALDSLLTLSMNYFYTITACLFVVMIWYLSANEYALASIILPVMHACIIIERYILITQMKRTLALVNYITALFIGISTFWVTTNHQIILLYSIGTSLYLLLMLLLLPNFRLKSVMLGLAVTCPFTLTLALKSSYMALATILISLIFILQNNPIDRKLLSTIK